MTDCNSTKVWDYLNADGKEDPYEDQIEKDRKMCEHEVSKTMDIHYSNLLKENNTAGPHNILN